MRFVSLLLIISLIFSFVLVKPTFGDFASGTGGEVLFWGFLGFMLIGAIAISMVQNVNAEANRQVSGWIEENSAQKGSFYLHRGIPPSFSFVAKVINNSLVYPNPKKESPIGNVFTGEEYGVENVKQDGTGVWYEIKFNSDHLLPK